MKVSRALAVLAAVAALVLTGCTTTPGGVAPPTSEPLPIEAAWLDDGRFFAVIAWGSSSCHFSAERADADGQHITVELSHPDATECTADRSPYPSLLAVPEGVDPKRDVQITLTFPRGSGGAREITLRGQPGLSGRGGESTNFQPSASAFGEDHVVLLTWGSSSCPPIVDDVVDGESGPLVTLRTELRPCTMDMAPRVTAIYGHAPLPDDAVLTLDGDGFDMVQVPILAR